MKIIFVLLLFAPLLQSAQLLQSSIWHYLVDKSELDAWQWQHDRSSTEELHSRVTQWLKEGKAQELHASWTFTNEAKSAQFRHGTDVSYPTGYQSAGALSWPLPTDMETRFMGYQLRMDSKRCEQSYSDMNLPQESYHLVSELSAMKGDRFIPNSTWIQHASPKLSIGIHLLKQVDAQGEKGPLGKYHLIFLRNSPVKGMAKTVAPLPKNYQVQMRYIRLESMPLTLLEDSINDNKLIERIMEKAVVVAHADGTGSADSVFSLNQLTQHIEPRSWFGGFERKVIGTCEWSSFKNGEAGIATMDVVYLKKNDEAKARSLPDTFDPRDVGLTMKIAPLSGDDAGWLSVDFQHSKLSKDVVLRRVEIDGKWEPDCVIHDLHLTEWKCTLPYIPDRWITVGAIRQKVSEDGKTECLLCLIKLKAL